MTRWTTRDLAKIGNADELAIASRLPDGTLGPFVTIWVVRSGDDLYVRSINGRSNPWFRRALAAGQGRIRAGGLERDVAFEEAGYEVRARVTAAYHTKYDRYSANIVGSEVSAKALKATLRLIPTRGVGSRAG
jgi:hypothetical protein